MLLYILTWIRECPPLNGSDFHFEQLICFIKKTNIRLSCRIYTCRVHLHDSARKFLILYNSLYFNPKTSFVFHVRFISETVVQITDIKTSQGISGEKIRSLSWINCADDGKNIVEILTEYRVYVCLGIIK